MKRRQTPGKESSGEAPGPEQQNTTCSGESRPLGTCVIFVTVPSKNLACSIAASLVEERLAACVNIVDGLTSIYRWEGSVQTDSECLLIIKSRAALFDRLSERVRSLHSYATPEIIALPITRGTDAYLHWIMENTTAG